MIFDHLHVAFLMIRAKPVRAMISWLGIFIGVLALILVLALYEGSRREVENLFRTEGAQVVMVHPAYDPETRQIGHLTEADISRIAAAPGVESVLPRLDEPRRVKSGTQSKQLSVSGVDETFMTLYRVPVIRGRIFLKREIASRQAVCMLTKESADALFPVSEPLDATIDIQGMPFQVIGIVAWAPEISMRAILGSDPQIFIPVAWLYRKGPAVISRLDVRLPLDLPAADAVELVRKAMAEGDSVRLKRFSIAPLDKYFNKRKTNSKRPVISLLAIAGISLLVGGIGIANVMLTSVTERTREVGIRKALGATRIDILMQFLVESVLLCAVGGITAVATAWLGIRLTGTLITDRIPLAIPPVPTALCLLATLLVGLVAGLYPASQAAALTPADALRNE